MIFGLLARDFRLFGHARDRERESEGRGRERKIFCAREIEIEIERAKEEEEEGWLVFIFCAISDSKSYQANTHIGLWF